MRGLVVGALIGVVGVAAAPAATAADVTGTLVTGVPLTVRTTAAGQQVRLRIPAAPAGTAGPIIRMTGFAAAPQNGGSTQAVIVQGDKEVSSWQMIGNTSWTEWLRKGVSPADLSEPSTLVLAPDPQQTISFTVLLTRPRSTTIAARAGQHVTARFSAPGEEVRITFPAPPGRRVVLRVGSQTVPVSAELTSAAGTVHSGGIVGTPGTESEVGDYPYTPQTDGSRLTLTLTTRVAMADDPFPSAGVGAVTVTPTLVTDPVFTAHGTTTVRWGWGEQPRLRFQGTLGTKAVALVTVPAGAAWNHLGARLTSEDVFTGDPVASIAPTGKILEFGTVLPTTGTYSLVFSTDDLAPGSVQVTVTSVTDQHLTATQGTPVHLALAAGQRAIVSVQMQSGQDLSWTVRGSTVPSTGLELWSGNAESLDFKLDQTVVAVGDHTGVLKDIDPLHPFVYDVVVDPVDDGAGTLDLTLDGVLRTP